MIAIINYGIGNVGSILNMFKKIGARAIIASDVSCVRQADKIVLPGVGAFDEGIERLRNLGFWDILAEKVIKDKTMILGICLGMQMFTRGSEEGRLCGFGWIDAETLRFRFTPLEKVADFSRRSSPTNVNGDIKPPLVQTERVQSSLTGFTGDRLPKIPHFGWNIAHSVRESFLFKNINDNSRFYFAHSYHVVCNSDKDILAKTTYGYEFVSAIQKGNIIGVQFHPEKSHKFGLQILKNFAEANHDV